MKKASVLLAVLASTALFASTFRPADAAYMVSRGDVFTWHMTSNSGTSIYIKGFVLSLPNETFSIRQEAYDPDARKAIETMPNVVVNMVTSREGITSISNDPASNPSWVSKTYAGRNVTCLSFSTDPETYGFIDNATGVACKASYNDGSSTFTVEIVSWTDVPFSTFDEPLLDMTEIIIVVFACTTVVFLGIIAALTRKKTTDK